MERLEQDLEISDNAARAQATSLEERLEKQRQRLEAAADAARAQAEAEVLRTQIEADKHLAAREELNAAKYAELERTTLADTQRRAACEQELRAELEETARRAGVAEHNLRAAQESVQEARARVARLEREASASQNHTVLQGVFALHTRLGASRQELAKLRAQVEQVREEATEALRNVGGELRHFCSFVLPLPHEAADKLKTEKLSPSQLAQGLKHMMGKYRGAAEQVFHSQPSRTAS